MISRRQFTKNTVTLAFMGLGSSLLGCASTPVGKSNAMKINGVRVVDLGFTCV
ncbi:hypothetical protein PCIT_a1891 [Pseudoalteromonas citrea]|uniref:Uncharacterized protein n=1 Tax=Pseudoalteromonas citrea TaxID=43655 RepID=A0AAD4FS46_9GAMM|nr:hypothetical protein PCIT_a1891 [Pseudoalteromonas citrea]